ncbi:CHAP domain-containing protein [Nonomuraea sp. NPDC050790]|uniref:CHAP domain-containing protein n=1 Tax=Nonomuraea sp. NPDC050790 TaxID=3364371 RepID=UPI0037B21A4D
MRLWKSLSCVLLMVAAALVAAPLTATPALADAGPFPASVAIDGRGSMNPADRVKTDAYLAGAPIMIVCQDSGPAAGGSTVWDYTSDRYWVPDAYVRTGVTGFLPGVPRCLSLGIDGHAAQGSPHGPYLVKVDVDGRGSADPADRVRVDAYMRDSQIFVKCQDHGLPAGGSTLWDYTSDGYWVPDAYVSTGTTGWIPGMPSCSSLGIPGGVATNPGGGRQFMVRTTLNGYHAKSLSATREEDRYLEGSYVTILCQAYGETNYGGSAVWDRTSDGLWIADYYVRTGSTGLVMNRCDADPPSSGGGNRYLVRTTLNGYHAKSLSATRDEDRYPGGSYVTIVCQAYGEFNYGGSAVWDRTGDGRWIPDYYVKTGSTGIVMNRCDDDPMPTGGEGNPVTPAHPPTGSVGAGDLRDRIVKAAYSQLGTAEWGDNCNPYGVNGSVKCGWAWCSMFASWTWRQAGIDVFLPYSGSFYSWGRSRGTLRTLGGIRPGDVVLYGASSGDSSHVGVVVDVDGLGNITTIEGNRADAVRKIGPFSPNLASPGGYSRPIYAVVSPVADTSTRWEQIASVPHGDPGTMTCSPSLPGNAATPEYKTCLEYSPGGQDVRAVAVVRSQSEASVVRAHLTLKIPDLPAASTGLQVRCESALAGYTTRKCVTPWRWRGIGAVVADVRYDLSGSTFFRSVGDLKFRGWRQEDSKRWCGPAALQAVLATMGADPVPSQRELADATNNTVVGSPPWDVAGYPVRLSGYDYVDNMLINTDDDPVSVARMWSRIRTFIDKGQPSIVVAKSVNLPWILGDGPALERHYVVIHGYATMSGPDGETFQLRVWDPQTARFHYATVPQLMTAARSAVLPAKSHFITPRS